VDRVRIVDKRLFSWKDVDKVLKGVLLQHMRAFFATIGTVNQRSPYPSLLDLHKTLPKMPPLGKV